MAAEATAGAAPKTAASVKTKTVARTRLTEMVPDKVHTWPYLVRLEMLVGTLVMGFLTAWSILVDAPLEEPANPTKTPNPSKAPWYFLGLQEILVYFDPWFAGVVLPSLIIVGLMVIPYIDINPKGNGYYCFKDRWFAISVYLFGFLVMWVSLVIMGTFLRGPGWYFFWPWQYWDVHKTVAITNRNFTEVLGLGDDPNIDGSHNWVAMLAGAGAVGAFVTGIPLAYWIARAKTSATLQKLGSVRYWITATFFMIMVGTVLKVILRLGFSIKYVLHTPWINV
jgi:Cytochrome b(C-terminal)/b6/petD